MNATRLVILALALGAGLALGGCATGSYVGAGVGANPLPHYAANAVAAPAAAHGPTHGR